MFGMFAVGYGRERVGREYGRYEPEYDGQFVDMYRTCVGTMVATATDATDDQAVAMLDDFERHSLLEVGKPWKPIVRLISIGNRWWYLPHVIDDLWFTIFLAPEREMVREVLDRRSNTKGFEAIETW